MTDPHPFLIVSHSFCVDVVERSEYDVDHMADVVMFTCTAHGRQGYATTRLGYGQVLPEEERERLKEKAVAHVLAPSVMADLSEANTRLASAGTEIAVLRREVARLKRSPLRKMLDAIKYSPSREVRSAFEGRDW